MQIKYFILVLSIISLTGCHTNYYYYSYKAHQTLSQHGLNYAFMSNGDRVTIPVTHTTKSGKLYTMVCNKKRQSKSYMWEDKVLVEKEPMTKLQIENYKMSRKLLKRF